MRRFRWLACALAIQAGGCSLLVPGPGDLRVEEDGGTAQRDSGTPDIDGGAQDGGSRVDGGDAGCEARTYYRDQDEDTYGDPNDTVDSCDPVAGYVTNADDCDDGSGAVFPGGEEICNDADDDCDTAVDEGLIGPVGEPASVFDRSASVLVRHSSGYLAAGSNGRVAVRWLDNAGSPLSDVVSMAAPTGVEQQSGVGGTIFESAEGVRAVIAWREGSDVFAQTLMIEAGGPAAAPVPVGTSAGSNISVIQLGNRVVLIWVDAATSELVARAMDPIFGAVTGSEARRSGLPATLTSSVPLATSPPSALVGASAFTLEGAGILTRIELSGSLRWITETISTGPLTYLPDSGSPLDPSGQSATTFFVEGDQCWHQLTVDAPVASVGTCELLSGRVAGLFDRGGVVSLMLATAEETRFAEVPADSRASGTPSVPVAPTLPSTVRLSFHGNRGVMLFGVQQLLSGGGGIRYTAASIPLGCTP